MTGYHLFASHAELQTDEVNGMSLAGCWCDDT